MDVRLALIGLFQELGFQGETLSDGTRLREDLAIDSTELVEIAVAIERRVSVSISTGHFQALDTFGEVIEFVQSAPAKQMIEEDASDAAHSAQRHDRTAAR
jgi:acyl carrier protein